MQYDYKVIEEKMKQLPQDIQAMLTSPQITNTIKEIANANEIKLDQEEVMYDLIAYILLGLMKSKDFIKTFSEEAGVNTRISTNIAKDINEKIFGKMKTKMQEVEEAARESDPASGDQSVSTLERVGGFELDKPAVEAESNDVTSADKASILAGVENPEPTVPTMTTQKSSVAPHSAPAPINLPTGTPTWSEGKKPAPSPAKITKNEQHTEPIVDFLLGNAAAAPAQKVVSTPPPSKPTTPTAPPVPTSPKKSGPDPYREPIQ